MKNKFLILSLLSLTTLACTSACSPKTPAVDTNNSSASVEPVASVSQPTSDKPTDVNSCQESQTLTCEPEKSQPATEVVKGDGWELTVPFGLQKKVVPDQEVVLSLFSNENKALLILLKEKYAGSYDEYIISSTRSLKDSGASLDNSKPMIVRDQKFTLMESTKNGVKVWSMVTFKDGFGYALSCGGPAPYDNVYSFCSPVFDSITLK